jgi:hypothetical protein
MFIISDVSLVKYDHSRLVYEESIIVRPYRLGTQ